MLITVVMAIIHSITAEDTGHTLAIVEGKGRGATLLCGGLSGWVSLTSHLVPLKLHSIGAATHPLEVWNWEAEMAAVAVGMGGLTAVVSSGLEVSIVRFHVHYAADATSNNGHITTIRLPDPNNRTQSPVC